MVNGPRRRLPGDDGIDEDDVAPATNHVEQGESVGWQAARRDAGRREPVGADGSGCIIAAVSVAAADNQRLAVGRAHIITPVGNVP